MSNWTREELQQLFEEVARRATVDPAFRALALEDAAGAIRQITTKTLPLDVSVKFVDNSGPTKLVPLPDPVPGISEETVELEGIKAATIQIGFFPTEQKPALTTENRQECNAVHEGTPIA